MIWYTREGVRMRRGLNLCWVRGPQAMLLWAWRQRTWMFRVRLRLRRDDHALILHRIAGRTVERDGYPVLDDVREWYWSRRLA